MSREIKFRAWDEIGKWMGNVTSFDFDEGAVFIETKHLDDENRFDMNNVPVVQYTGLKDKNGKEIYEGDILRYLDSYDCSTESGYDFEEFLNVGQVIFNDEKGRFDITNKSDISYDDWIESVSDCEIIGNIYENPELLEGIA